MTRQTSKKILTAVIVTLYQHTTKCFDFLGIHMDEYQEKYEGYLKSGYPSNHAHVIAFTDILVEILV